MKEYKNLGKIIAVIGPDGCGKSTILKNLKERCIDGKKPLINFHWRPGFLPYRKRYSSSKNLDSFAKPHSTKIRNPLFSFFILIYIYIDFILGYNFILKPKLKKGINIYYERYFFDLVLDQKRYGLKIPTKVIDILVYFMYKPDRVVILDAPSNVIFERKQELSINEIDRQQSIIESVFRKWGKVTKLDVATNNPKVCGKFIFDLINQKNGEA